MLLLKKVVQKDRIKGLYHYSKPKEMTHCFSFLYRAATQSASKIYQEHQRQLAERNNILHNNLLKNTV